MKIIDLNHTDAQDYFLKQESYCNFDLPSYFSFENIIQIISAHIRGQDIATFFSTYINSNGQTKLYSPSDFDDVNYKCLDNKDGKFARRPLQLIHPALYVSLVHKITEQSNWNTIVTRLQHFQSNGNIRCYSIPLRIDNNLSNRANTINQWRQEIEQQSLELALKYQYTLHTDIQDCYGSLYTHSIAWAIHTKPFAKANRRVQSLIGNTIDKHLQNMSNGQTNGIPQGSILMDFIAEIVLGYADSELSDKIQSENIQDYEIIRYRDDYRIFSNNPQTCEKITKLLTETLIDLGMRLNPQKTIISDNVVSSSLKPDKLYYLTAKKSLKDIQGHLMLIHTLAERYPNSGSLSKALDKFFNRIKGLSEINHSIKALISILTDIMYKNPRIYPIGSAILSKLLSLIHNDERDSIMNLIEIKLNKLPNIGHLKIWLQRITIKLDRQKIYDENICKKINDPTIQIWNSGRIENNLKTLVENTSLVDESIIDSIDTIIRDDEVQLFRDQYSVSTIEE